MTRLRWTGLFLVAILVAGCGGKQTQTEKQLFDWAHALSLHLTTDPTGAYTFPAQLGDVDPMLRAELSMNDAWGNPLHYRRLRDGAASVVTSQSMKPTSRQQAGGATSRRDAWLARSVAEAIVVWDGEDDRVGKLVRSLVVQLGEEEVWVVEPGV